MSQREEMFDWFLKRPFGKATLNDILRSGQRFSYEWRARKTEFNQRDPDWEIVLLEENHANPGANLYQLKRKVPVAPAVDADGQLRLAV